MDIKKDVQRVYKQQVLIVHVKFTTFYSDLRLLKSYTNWLILERVIGTTIDINVTHITINTKENGTKQNNNFARPRTEKVASKSFVIHRIDNMLFK